MYYVTCKYAITSNILLIISKMYNIRYNFDVARYKYVIFIDVEVYTHFLAVDIKDQGFVNCAIELPHCEHSSTLLEN